MLTNKNSKGIESLTETGGYFGLDLPDYGDPFPNALKFQSGRAALRAALEFAGIKRVVLPAYICDSVIQAVFDSGAIVETYFLDASLYPKGLPDSLPDGSALLYINYFGLCQKNVDRLLQDISSKQLIVDNGQALFEPATNALATIYSVRKFLGVPDGGLLVVPELEIKDPEDEDTDSMERMKHLLLRMAYSASDGYSNYVQSENSLSNTKPLRMSRLSKRIFASVDMNTVKQRRRDNFVMLASQLDKHNIHKWILDKDSVPLCYPLVVGWNVEQLKKQLIKEKIYIPTYWNEAKARIECSTIESFLTDCCVAVPCDQRYSPSQISRLADVIVSRFEHQQ